MAADTAARHGVLDDTGPDEAGIPRIHRGWLIALGIGLILLGTVAFFVPWLTTVASVAVFGWTVFFGGAFEIAAAIGMRGWRGVLVHLLSGILGLVVGAMLFMHPIAGSLALTLLLAALFVVGGSFRIGAAVVLRFPRWGWAVVSGLITMALGFFVWSGWPLTSVWVIGALVAVDLVCRGWAWIMAGAAMR